MNNLGITGQQEEKPHNSYGQARTNMAKPTTPRPSLINLVGAPLENVVGSAEMPIVEGPHLMMKLVAMFNIGLWKNIINSFVFESSWNIM